MKKTNSKMRSDCPINYALELFGDKWSLLVIRDLMFKDKHRYREFQQSKEKIATNILADRLAKLEANGLITKKADPENQKSAIYNLTEKGVKLMPLMVELIKWSATYDEDSANNSDLIGVNEKNAPTLVKELYKSLMADV